MGRALLQTDQNARLFIDVLRAGVKAKEFQIHDFVAMPNHIHLPITVMGDKSIEKAMQLIKGRFSYRIKKEHGYIGEVWQKGFSESRVTDQQGFVAHQAYIAENPVKAGLVDSAWKYPYCFAYLVAEKAAGAKARPLL
jgi:putative transposase